MSSTLLGRAEAPGPEAGRATVAKAAPVRPASRSDGIYDAILAGIANGTYPAHARLPSEHDLAGRFQVSRPVVRAALDRLRREGTIVSRQGAGSFVRPREESGPAPGFAPVESIADIQRCYEFRLTLEPDAAFHAATRRDAAALDRIAAALDLLAAATRREQHREDADFAFHHAVAVASNNHYYAASLQALQSHVAVGMKIHGLALLGPRSGLQGVLEEHHGIFAAIRDGEAEAAQARMTAHIRASRDRLFEGRLLDLSM
ncbi:MULTISPECIES: FadR/GntR family transcriptional regulator [unclassified Methylobacterium]|jgi:GntR family transcriptional regulator, transcriptional repressor for pyruvate dehydrogenase complex|uniref:FadR/GntR family transcriptional regulator n=1 Tax=unclassified Methylobacterium TaxID=2615210 RepID=UPI0013554790|nr:FCD domain-containing protein [Methylobacterium sp. 2A]MWV20466.1 FadR family transcriptional regulator [Methylobacterium sp. 2A]